MELCGVDDFAPASVRFDWQTATHEADQYVVQVQAVLLEPGGALDIGLTGVAGGDANLDAGGPVQGMAMVNLRCKREVRSGLFSSSTNQSVLVKLFADGRLEVP